MSSGTPASVICFRRIAATMSIIVDTPQSAARVDQDISPEFPALSFHFADMSLCTNKTQYQRLSTFEQCRNKKVCRKKTGTAYLALTGDYCPLEHFHSLECPPPAFIHSHLHAKFGRSFNVMSTANRSASRIALSAFVWHDLHSHSTRSGSR